MQSCRLSARPAGQGWLSVPLNLGLCSWEKGAQSTGPWCPVQHLCPLSLPPLLGDMRTWLPQADFPGSSACPHAPSRCPQSQSCLRQPLSMAAVRGSGGESIH